MRYRKAYEVIIPNGVHGVCLLWNVWAFHMFARYVLSVSSTLYEGRISYKR